MVTLQEKNAVITGGSDGIGLGIAKAFAQNGANLILIGRNPEKLASARRQLTAYDVEVHTIEADLADVSQVEGAVSQILAVFPQVDILVNNAGLGRFIPFAETDEALFDAHFNLNVKTPYFLTQRLLPQLEASQGNVINISSGFADRMLPGRTTTAYSMTKGALNSFTKSLAFEVGPMGVRVNAIAPGNVETPQMNRNLQALPEEKQQAFRQIVKVVYPLQKIGSSEDIGEAAAFLASDQAKWITGTVLAVDGGLTTN
ncbi:SDR family NAD(P)-dependent oxidoreductase [Streptococcus dentiloxodontae]